MDKKTFDKKAADFNDNVNELMVTGRSTSGVTFEEAFEIAEKTPVEVMQELKFRIFQRMGRNRNGPYFFGYWFRRGNLARQDG
jgi:hypothetical protein